MGDASKTVAWRSNLPVSTMRWTGPDTWRSPSTITAMLPCTKNPSDRALMFTHRGSTGWDEPIEQQARPVARIATDRGRERAHLRDELSRRDAVLDEGLRRHRAVAHLVPPSHIVGGLRHTG